MVTERLDLEAEARLGEEGLPMTRMRPFFAYDRFSNPGFRALGRWKRELIFPNNEQGLSGEIRKDRSMGLILERSVASGAITMVEATPGQRLMALMLCVFGGREALGRAKKFYEGRDLERLFGPVAKARDFNDDALGRALDKPVAVGAKKVFSTVPSTPWPYMASPGRTSYGHDVGEPLRGRTGDTMRRSSSGSFRAARRTTTRTSSRS